MKTLSIQQPWASLLGEQVKTIELRGWRTPYRGPLLIRSSRNSSIRWENDEGQRVKLPTECLLFVGELVDVKPMQPEDRLAAMSVYWNEDFSWVIRFCHYVHPRPAAGKLKLYETPDSLIQRLPEKEIRLHHPELKPRTRHTFKAEVINKELVVTDKRTGAMPYYTVHRDAAHPIAHALEPLYGYIGGIRGGNTPIAWQELADSINEGFVYQRVGDLPLRP